MINKYKNLVAPIVALVAIAINLLFDVDISEEMQSQFAENVIEIVILVSTLIGVIQNNIKKD